MIGFSQKSMTADPPKVRTAASYLLMLQTADLEGLQKDSMRVIQAAMDIHDFEVGGKSNIAKGSLSANSNLLGSQLLQDVIRFLKSLDHSGELARKATKESGLL